MSDKKLAIIGAGIAGLACASKLKTAGYNPIVFDKGRGVGGRVATRRTSSGLQFDHGAQYVTAKSEKFDRILRDAEQHGYVGTWSLDAGNRQVGLPGMNGLAKHLASGLEIHLNSQVSSLRETVNGYEIKTGYQVHRFEMIVVTVPAPQALALIGSEHSLSAELAGVEMQPCLTLMAAFNQESQESFTARRDVGDPIAWIALDSSKPGRTTEHCWVAQASPEWSTKFLEEDLERISERMLPMLCDRIGITKSAAVHSVAHRWRYSVVSSPLGKPFVKNNAGTLFLGGDWCLDARVEAAWTSGNAIADDILDRY
ncbi:MAG: FAD-dependent oxidoreductase [Pseudomonadota bacterium]